ncbi:DUF2237 family protein [Aliikangiella coralliicola]|uniref:DUF2237 domain-containing protein n=1 Tax=Aliikangiella coralliicola TaxID=2592383 RepID=A0A545U4Q2_9GAMM|nr:DUF2237 domain-containing protein [Aliikangiella coralliicola]TQV84449.1 DUF2237 domain-containing protein [Aliikangiella coralliicola]
MEELDIEPSLNVFDEPLIPCSEDPVTGFFRDGCCNTSKHDSGSHTVCVEVNKEFLEYSRFRGNDLSTPIPEFGFPGLVPGDRWCLCAARWLEAHQSGMAPKVFLQRTHKKALEIVPLKLLCQFAKDLN